MGSLQEGLGRLILRPCVPGSIILAVLIISLVVHCVAGLVPTALQGVMLQEGLSWWFLRYIKPSDQTWEFIQDILFCSLGFFFFYIILFWYHFSIYRLMSSGGKEQQPKKPVCSCLNVGHFQGKDKGSTWFLKSPKGPSKNSAWLVDAKAKGLPFNS